MLSDFPGGKKPAGEGEAPRPFSQPESRALFERVALEPKDINPKLVEDFLEYARKMRDTKLDMNNCLGVVYPSAVADFLRAGGNLEQVGDILKNVEDKKFSDDAGRKALTLLYKLLHQCRTAKKR